MTILRNLPSSRECNLSGQFSSNLCLSLRCLCRSRIRKAQTNPDPNTLLKLCIPHDFLWNALKVRCSEWLWRKSRNDWVNWNYNARSVMLCLGSNQLKSWLSRRSSERAAKDKSKRRSPHLLLLPLNSNNLTLQDHHSEFINDVNQNYRWWMSTGLLDTQAMRNSLSEERASSRHNCTHTDT